MAEWREQLPFELREVPPFHATSAGPGWAVLTAFDGPDASSNGLTIAIRRNAIVADGRTFFQLLRVLPDQIEVRFSAVGESRALEDVRVTVLDIASSLELNEQLGERR
jgi:hypothetical protein